MKRGKTWQECPGCGLQTERSDGCNHMTCPSSTCQENYCFICGIQADGDSGHWQRSVSDCPKYNHPDDDNPRFEDDPDPELEAYLETLKLISRYENEIRVANPDQTFPEIDGIVITDEMVERAQVDVNAQETLCNTRRLFFVFWAMESGHEVLDTDIEVPPREYSEAILYCYRIFRMVVEESQKPDTWDVKAAFNRYTGYWRKLSQLRRMLPAQWMPENDEDLRKAIRDCYHWKYDSFHDLNDLVQAEEGGPNTARAVLVNQFNQRKPDDSGLVSTFESQIREENPQTHFTEVREVFITQEMVDQTNLRLEVLHRLNESRHLFFMWWDLRNKSCARWGWPMELPQIALQCYRILRMQVELHHAPDDWDAEAALLSYGRCCTELNQVRRNMLAEDFEDYEEDFKDMVEACKGCHEEVIQNLVERCKQSQRVSGLAP